ncbi:MAG: family Rossman fold protein [Flaviaesturariibacter sp.]|nr:family Rossman fold protein [Flaviaesturariibacter sp.]
MPIKSLAIFCGSKVGKNPLYQQHAEQLGKILADASVELIFGGGKNGLMGASADSAMAAGGTVRGVIPEVLRAWEHQHTGISELLVVEDMHVRKRKLYDLSDAAIILPGGFGTLDELFEMLTWNQLSIHDKKIFLLNSAGFYNHLIGHMQVLESEGFLYGSLPEKLVVLNEPSEIITYINEN